MKCQLYYVDHIKYWQDGCLVKEKCKHQHDVFMFNPESGTCCCEATQSYYMLPSLSGFHLKDKDGYDDEELLESIDDSLAKSMPDPFYIHCRSVTDLPTYQDAAEIPEDPPSAFVLVWADDPEAEELEDFLDGLHGNPPT